VNDAIDSLHVIINEKETHLDQGPEKSNNSAFQAGAVYHLAIKNACSKTKGCFKRYLLPGIRKGVKKKII